MGLNDHAEISFVEVVVHFYEPEDKVFKDSFTHSCLFDLEIDDYGEDIQEIVEGKAQNEKNREEAEKSGKGWWVNVVSDWEEDFIITKPFAGFEFRCFGQTFDDTHSSGLDYEIYSVGPEWVFKAWKDELEKIAHDLQEKFKIRKLKTGWDGKTVRFVTLWSYHSWEDSYNHEWDSEWELLGVVTPSKKLLEIE